jgi:hypothetical protein
MANSKLMPCQAKLLFDQQIEALKRSVKWVYEDLGQGNQLRSSIPSIAAVNNDIVLFLEE